MRTLKPGLIALALTAVAVLPAGAIKIPFVSKDKEAQTFVPKGTWEAYIHDDKGRDRPLVKPVEKNSDKDWMFLQFTPYKGPRSRVAVMKVENKTAEAEDGSAAADHTIFLFKPPSNVEVPLAAIEELITTSMTSTHRFDMIERKRIQTAMAEQDFGASGRVGTATAAKIGKLLGAEYQLIAAVNEWTPDKSSIGATGGKFLGGLGGSRGKAEVAISFRLIDATSGQVVSSFTERATAGSWGISLAGLGPLAGLGYKSHDAVNYAVQSCINKAIYKMAMATDSRPWRGTVIKVAGNKVYINAGSKVGIEMGMKLTALARGEDLVDPETQLPVGEDDQAIGNLTVTTVQDNVAIATVVQGCKGLKQGDRVEIAASDGV